MNKPQADGKVNHVCRVLVWLNWILKGQQQTHWLIKWD